MRQVRSITAVLLLIVAGVRPAAGQSSADGFWSDWFRRSDAAKAEQPHWITPLATTTPRLEQEYRFDVDWQQARPGGAYTQNYGNTKGLELIPADRVEVIVGVPGYVVHNSPAVANGFGDLSLLVKYRLAAANEEHGNYILTAFLSSTFPTATNGNGNVSSVVTPTIAYGKGFASWDVQGTFGAGLPTGHEATIGRTYALSNTIQDRLPGHLWPELEVNTTWFQDGRNDGKHQVFLTPGLVAGRFPLVSRVGLTVGAGVQTAVSAFHTFNHNYILSARLPF